MKKKHTHLTNDEVRIIKIGEEALSEFIFEKLIDGNKDYLEVDSNASVTNSLHIDWEKRTLIFCAYKNEDKNGDPISLPDGIDLDVLIHKIPDTTDSLYANMKYKKYTKSELEDICK